MFWIKISKMIKEKSARASGDSFSIGQKLKGSLPKGSFDKHLCIDLPVALPVPIPMIPPDTPPFPASHLPQQTTPHHPPEPDPKLLPQGRQQEPAPLCETTPVKTTHQFPPESISRMLYGLCGLTWKRTPTSSPSEAAVTARVSTPK